MRTGRNQHLSDGQWADVPEGLVKMACCDCGLVHLVQIERDGRGFRFRAWRDTRATAAKRAANRRKR